MELVNADTPQLMAEAASFDRLCGDLSTVLGQVDSTATGLQAAMVGEAGGAAQAALVRFNEAATQQIRLLTDISENINISGTQYADTDANAAQDLASKMV